MYIFCSRLREDVSLEKAVQFIKGGFSFLLKSKLEVWERGYNQTQTLSVEKFEACRRYVEMNPVQQRMVLSPEESETTKPRR